MWKSPSRKLGENSAPSRGHQRRRGAEATFLRCGRSVAVFVVSVGGGLSVPVVVMTVCGGRSVSMIVMTMSGVVAVARTVAVIVVRLVLVAHCESVPQPLSAVFAEKSV